VGGASVVDNSSKRLIGDAGTGKSRSSDAGSTSAAKQTKSEDPNAEMANRLGWATMRG
jgi:hypothetical protein